MLPIFAFAAFLLAQAAGEDGVVMPVYQSCAEAFADNEWLSSNSRSFYISNPTQMSSLRNERSNVTRCAYMLGKVYTLIGRITTTGSSWTYGEDVDGVEVSPWEDSSVFGSSSDVHHDFKSNHWNELAGDELLVTVKTIGSITTVGPAGEAGVPCVFPFVYKNVTYSACTSVDHSGGWCATEVSKGTNEYTEWGDCPASPSSSICIKDTEDAVLLTKGRCLGGKPLARFFADLDWGCKGSATLETTQNDSCTHPCVNDVDVAHYDDGILNVGGQSTHVYFNTGEMDGVQEFNEDRFYVVGSSTPLAFTNGDGRNSNVDDPVGLGCYQSANGKVTSYNIGVNGEDICVPPKSGPPLAYHVWLAASATQPATTTITKTATATPSTTSTTAPSSSAPFFLVTTQPPRNEIETGIETNENLTELEQQAADDLASAPCSTLANANTRGLVAAVVIFALLTFGFMLTTIYLFRKLQTERASLRIRALTDQDATVEMMANPMLAGTQGSRQQHGPHRVRQPQHQISSGDSGDGDGDGDGGSNSAGIGSDAAQTASAVALQLYREPEANAELYEPPPGGHGGVMYASSLGTNT